MRVHHREPVATQNTHQNTRRDPSRSGDRGEEPARDCPLCPRLALVPRRAAPRIPGLAQRARAVLRQQRGDGFSSSVWRRACAAPTARAGPSPAISPAMLLYATLAKFGFAEGDYAERADDGLRLVDCRITNAVRCVPPENKPEPVEIKALQRVPRSGDETAPAAQGHRRAGRHRASGGAGGARRAARGASPSRMARYTRSRAACCSPTAITARATTRTPGSSPRRCSRRCSPGCGGGWGEHRGTQCFYASLENARRVTVFFNARGRTPRSYFSSAPSAHPPRPPR